MTDARRAGNRLRPVVGRLDIEWTPGWFGFGLHDELRLLWEIHGHPTQWVFRFGPWQIIRRKPSNNRISEMGNNE